MDHNLWGMLLMVQNFLRHAVPHLLQHVLGHTDNEHQAVILEASRLSNQSSSPFTAHPPAFSIALVVPCPKPRTHVEDWYWLFIDRWLNI